MISPEDLLDLKRIIESAIRTAPPADRPRLMALRGCVEELDRPLRELPKLRQELNTLKETMNELMAPPYQYGVFLGITPTPQSMSPEAAEFRAQFWDELERLLTNEKQRQTSDEEHERYQRYLELLDELRNAAPEPRDLVVGVSGQRYEVKLATRDVRLDELSEGQEILLTGKTMSVVGARHHHMRGDTAEVINVLSPEGTAKVLQVNESEASLRVQWPQGEKAEVECPIDLCRRLKPANIVRVTEDRKHATEKVKPRLHVRAGGSDGVVVEISDGLFDDSVEIGDMVRVDMHLQFAFEKLPSHETGELVLEDVPDVSYQDIGGLDTHVDVIRDAIELPYLHRSLFEEYHLPRTKGILLYGPPGCGKTMTAKAIANSLTHRIREHLQRLEQRLDLFIRWRQQPDSQELLREYMSVTALAESSSEAAAPSPRDVLAMLENELNRNDIETSDPALSLRKLQQATGREKGIKSFFLNVKGPELLNKWVGETEHRIRKIFEEAKRKASFYTPVVIFFDEMESLFRSRGSGRSSDVETTIVPQFLAEMDGVESSENVIIIGASNRDDMIDPAILRPGRLDVKIRIGRPEQSAAIQILALNLTPDLPLCDAGMPPGYSEDARLVIFKPHVVEKAVRKLGSDLTPEQLLALFSALARVRMPGAEPQQDDTETGDKLALRCDIRGAAASECAELQRLREDEPYKSLVAAAETAEHLAQALIKETSALIFHRSSQIEVVTIEGKRKTWPLSEFISGAILASIVARAKKQALKRQVDPFRARSGTGEVEGISFTDMRQAVQDEFDENAPQIAVHQIQGEMGGMMTGAGGNLLQAVEVHLADGESDPWSVEKVLI